MQRVTSIARVAILVSVVLLAVAQASCLGSRARDSVGVQTLSFVLVGVVEDAAAGIPHLPPGEQPDAAMQLAAFEAAVASNDRTTIAADAMPRWSLVRGLAEASITAREAAGAIGPGVAVSKRERLDRFHELLERTAAP